MPSPAGILATAQQTVTGSAAQFTTPIEADSVIVKAFDTNTGTVFIGGPDVTTGTGFPLEPGSGVGLTDFRNPSKVYLIGTPADKIAVLGIV